MRFFRVGRATAPVWAAVEALKISAPQVRLFVASPTVPVNKPTSNVIAGVSR